MRSPRLCALAAVAAAVALACAAPRTAAASGAFEAAPNNVAFANSVRQLLNAFDATAGTLDCDQAPYEEPLTINTPGLYRFRITALGANQNSARERACGPGRMPCMRTRCRLRLGYPGLCMDGECTHVARVRLRSQPPPRARSTAPPVSAHAACPCSPHLGCGAGWQAR